MSSTKVNFVERARAVHGDRYDYSKVEYVRSDKHVVIGCSVHGTFLQQPSQHWRGVGCPKCGRATSVSKTSSQKKFIEKATSVHAGKYDYSKVIYVNASSKVKIHCPQHGEFLQLARAHIGGRGCPKCSYESMAHAKADSKAEWIRKAKTVHGNKYRYDHVNYVDSQTHVAVTCIKHGDWKTTPANHLQDHGCPKCVGTVSKIEQQVANWLSKKVVVQTNDRKLLGGKELDIVVPEHKLAIELNGSWWHSEKFVEKKEHQNKMLRCEQLGIKLYQFWDFETLDRGKLIRSMLAAAVGQTKHRVYARQTSIVELTSKQSKEFFDQHHLQGGCAAKLHYGLILGDELVAAMTFGAPRFGDYDWELVRYANKMNHVVVGGASKLLAYFIKEHRPSQLVSYSDNRISTGHLYQTLGFEFSHITQPNYFWIKGNRRLSRYQTQKHKLGMLLPNVDTSKSEVENMKQHGWLRVWDAGNKVWLLKICGS